ncbi:hypothetical protein SERLA73DRAFT_45974 [Serpula lacrymans var. lacrymans S7.3]|uniref:Uncharacterized protein n=2 Tax=Serpula lacrymans var. lacrymans TaxID=341189 RepID=F8PL09_SERL3|nr:uncharacterized protein SERLADRAFT_433504 [Serpula lacrymans var. lacrymans S7.9]EGO03653.1 hypothetical protein SERLA73DRAFT_45974 [Serpula lacrymans var. lacrymans S7.3]EGO29519.1 hypothetical protein SERLADRAFT_433504 [Serpula lacrymans var. lacrymans S7.9]
MAPDILTPGTFTPEVIEAWEISCQCYFMHKSTPAAVQVRTVVWSIQDPKVRNWYQVNQARISSLSFDEYMSELRTVCLLLDWAAGVLKKIFNSKQGSRPFCDWAIECQSQNCLLRGTAFHLNDILMKCLLENNMDDGLALDYYYENITEEDVTQ